MRARRTGRGGPRAGAGRPPAPVEERQRNRVTVNLTDAEHAALLEVAGEQLPAAFAREVLVRFLRRRRR